jgi:hypothetical protein
MIGVVDIVANGNKRGKMKANIKDNFSDDDEKMADFEILTKEEFLTSYSYLTEQEYDNTKREVNND